MPIRLAIACLLLLAPAAVQACQIPVFRYALERWPSDFYELAIFHRGELSEEQEILVDDIGLNANIEAVLIDLAEEGRPGRLDFYGEAEIAEGQLFARLFFPPVSRIEAAIWEGALTKESYAVLVDSPVRRQIVKGILAGESAVWVLLESGDKVKDDKFEAELRAYLKEAEEYIEIPEGVVGPGSLERVASGEVAMEDVLRSEIPLKISFDVIRMKRGDAAEAVFEKMLLAVSTAPEEMAGEPMAFPLFGRGRTVDSLPAPELDEEVIAYACSYLCGACSCEVKRQNPGIDLLFAADWESALEGSEVVIDKVLPPLDGVGDLVSAEVRPPEAETSSPAGDVTPDPVGKPAAKPDAKGFGSPLLKNMMWLCGALLLILMAVTIFMKRSTYR